MKEKIDKLIDHLYENKKLLIIYFIIALILSVIKYFLTAFFGSITISGGEILAWTIWALMFYPAQKLLAFRNHCEHIWALLRQISIYIMCIGALWFANKLLLAIFFMLTGSAGVAIAIGGAITEIICLAIMWKVVFKN